MYPGATRQQDNGDVMLAKPIYLAKHHVTTAHQTIVVTVPSEPGHVGVDPRGLLVDVRPRDNFVDVSRAGERAVR